MSSYATNENYAGINYDSVLKPLEGEEAVTLFKLENRRLAYDAYDLDKNTEVISLSKSLQKSDCVLLIMDRIVDQGV